MGSPISKFYQSFSGTDTIAFLMMPGCTPIVIGSLTTISYSMYRNKKPVINIGRTNINGVTRGSRIFAGTMIFTLINQHWLRELQDQWIKKYNYENTHFANFSELKVDELPLFDIMIISANEYGSAVSMFIFGIDFTDEAQTISVEDLFTENTFSFIARDISIFKKFSTDLNSSSGSSSDQLKNATISSIEPLKSFVFDNNNSSLTNAINPFEEYFNWTDAANSIKEYFDNKVSVDNILNNKFDSNFTRELYYSNSMDKPFIGKDVILVQEQLKKLGFYDGEIDGFYDRTVAESVKKYQSNYGLEPTGKIDIRTWKSLMKYDTTFKEKVAIVINKNGTNAYSEPNLASNINYHYAYNDSLLYDESKEIIDEQGGVRRFLKNKNGWIYSNDIYSVNFDNGVIEFPTLRKDVNNPTSYVIMLQNALSTIYKEFKSFKYGVYDEETIKFVDKFKDQYGDKYGLSNISGEVDQSTWIAIEDVANKNFGNNSKKNLFVEMSKHPGHYNVTFESLNDFFIKLSSDSKIKTIVTGITHFKNDTTRIIKQEFSIGGRHIDSNNNNVLTVTQIEPLNDKEEVSYIGTSVDENGQINIMEWAEFIVAPLGCDPYKWIFYFDK